MSLSLFLRNLVIGGALAAALPSLGLAQAAFSTNGGEYLLSGSLRGDQTSPNAGLSPAGGYVVWNDNALDAKGGAVAALAVDSNFKPVSARFRVNVNPTVVQERPSVALLKDGGAVFVWQGGRPGMQHIYARFLSPTNTWLTGDVLINSFTNNLQRHPAVAVLVGGNVVIAWGSLNQRSATSLQDVYAQILTPSGQKVGVEFPVNQFTAYNQRTPAVSALPSGGFVVSWVSEQQRILAPEAPDANQEFVVGDRPSIDVYARVFDPMGAPMGSEFLVNSAHNACADPAVSALASGFYVVTWAEKDLTVRSNGWDVIARQCYGPATAGPALRANTFIYGDQFAPTIGVVGTNYLVAWTSLGQDGSWEGVYGRFLQGDGAPVGNEFLVNSNRVSRQIQPAVISDGTARFLVAWSSFTGFQRGFDIFGQQYASADYVPTVPVVAVYGAPTNGSSGGKGTEVTGDPGSSDGAAMDLNAPPAAAFPVTTVASNAFAKIQGTYNGLFYDDTVVDPSRCGALNVSVRAGGAFSGRLYLGGKTYSLSGKFNPQDGWATNTIRRSASSSLTLRLQFDADQGYQLGGTLTDNQRQWTAQLHADRLVYSRTSNPATPTGKTVSYTVVLTAGTNQDFGYGYGTVRLDPSGTLSWSGTLADGTKVSQSTTLSRDGYWPLYSSLSLGNGVLLGWMQLSSQPGSDMTGDAIWTRPAAPSAKYYPQGFTNTVTALGSVYAPPAVGARVLGMTQGRLSFSGGQTSDFSQSFTLDSRNRVSAPAGSGLSLSFSSSGLFTGSTRSQPGSKLLSFQGVLFPQGTNGAGLFLGTKQSGRVELTPIP